MRVCGILNLKHFALDQHTINGNRMYYYLSFLRPPPTSIDLASSGTPGVTITPQIANDLRTE